MRKILYFVAVSLLGISCNRDDEKGTTEQSNLELKVSTTQDLSNLRVGESVEVRFEIQDKDTINTTYVLRPQTEYGEELHQKIGVDFSFRGRNPKFGYYEDVNEIKLKSELQAGIFYIKILQPGTFRHKYILEKYVKGAKVSEAVADFSFNAVKIDAWTYVERLGNNKYRKHWKFKIDDGKNWDDTSFDSDKTNIYNVLYKNVRYTQDDGKIKADQERNFRHPEESNTNKFAPLSSELIDEIVIEQRTSSAVSKSIIYYNVRIQER